MTYITKQIKALSLVAVTSAAVFSMSDAQALPFANASFSLSAIAPSSFTTSGGSDISFANSFTIGTNAGGFEFGIDGTPTGDFAPALSTGFTGGGTGRGDMVDNTPLVSGVTLDFTAGFTPVFGFMTWASGSNPAHRYSFDMLTLTKVSSSPGFLLATATGNFHDSAGIFAVNGATFNFSANVTGGSTSWSMSWATSGTNRQVPEPDSMALMGLGLAALSLIARKKKSA